MSELLVSVQVQRGLCEKVRFFPSCPGNRAMLTVCLLEGWENNWEGFCSVCALCWAQELPNREGLGGRGVPAKIRISAERFQCPGQLYSLAELEMHRAPATPCLCNTERLLGGVRIQIAPDNSQLMWEKYRALFLFSGEKEKNKFKYVFWTDDSNHHAVICPCSFRMNVWRMFGKQIWSAFLCVIFLSVLCPV